MENFESLTSLIDEFHIKPSSLEMFNINYDRKYVSIVSLPSYDKMMMPILKTSNNVSIFYNEDIPNEEDSIFTSNSSQVKDYSQLCTSPLITFSSEKVLHSEGSGSEELLDSEQSEFQCLNLTSPTNYIEFENST